MKNTLVLTFVAMVLFSCSHQSADKNRYTIHGVIEGIDSEVVYLSKRMAGEWIRLDSTELTGNNFSFTGTLDYPEILHINVSGSNAMAVLFTEPSEIHFHTSMDNFRNATVTGSSSHNEYRGFTEKLRVFDDLMEEAWRNAETSKNEGNLDAETKWRKEFTMTEKQMKAYILDNARLNNASVVAAYNLLRNAYYYDEFELDPVTSTFDPAIEGSVYVVQLKERVETLKRVAIGQPAINFIMEDMEDNPVELASLTGAYLLIDFWASWCGPCRRQKPYLVAAYNQYHPKGLNIIGVSLDNNKEKWIEAIESDKLTWHHVSDLRGWSNEAAKLYAINSIPANVLLNPEGIIIAKNISGEEMMEKFGELIKN